MPKIWSAPAKGSGGALHVPGEFLGLPYSGFEFVSSFEFPPKRCLDIHGSKKKETKAAPIFCFGLRPFNAKRVAPGIGGGFYGLFEGLPFGYERLPDELPLELLPGEVAPPVAEPEFIPKYEKMLWSHPGFVRSVVESNAGALCSLLVSPE